MSREPVSRHPAPRDPAPRDPARRLDPVLKWGLILFAVGSGPLFAVILAAKLGLTRDPNPNPVGFGMLAFFTFWPSVLMIIFGAVRTAERRRGSPRPDA